MSGPADIFRELHRLRRHTRGLQDQIERGPRLLKAHQVKITRQEESLHEAHEVVKKLKVANHAKEVTLKEKQQQVAKYEEQRNKATTRKEYDTLQAEITSAKESCRRIEDDILEGMMKVEEGATAIPAAEKAVEQAKQEYAEFERTTKERLAIQAEELRRVQQQIKEVEAGLPAEVRPAYDRLVNVRGEDALSEVRSRTCTACNTEITAQMYNDLLVGRLVSCKSCGRVLYLPESPV
jgi:predicted  nucleic acid-binding Zn-ribbon protein